MNKAPEANESNPFRQCEGYYALRFIVPQSALELTDEIFEDISLSLSSFEADAEGTIWQIEILTEEPIAEQEIDARLTQLAEQADFEKPIFETSYIQQRDWVSEVQKSFPPITAVRFFVYGSHYTEDTPKDLVPIKINAGMAFGSGEHETTSTCLAALDNLGQERDFNRLLDMGCGSGILAIAMAKIWKHKVVAADIDPVAVAVTEENAKHNGEYEKLICCISDGYDNAVISKRAPYDLIVANILARPLCDLAPALAEHLAPNGVAVLSGLLDRQEAEVLNAHAAQGLSLIKRYPQNGWHTLVIGRK
ncbi:MAG: 50S ribosomal protein L11 methyltransferase [Alphaproteobacteria bacterium]|nr:50S ribosomal protein L11 methyltransferase [Alphaproteobacteria bacterium]